MQPPTDADLRPSTASLKRVYRDARRDPALAVLEGMHALKHALRFGAQVLHTAVVDPTRLRALAAVHAPDVLERMLAGAQTVSLEVFGSLAPLAPSTGVIALARRPATDPDVLLADARPAPIVLLEAPRDLGNIGACVRVAAAADVAGVLTTGVHDPWDPAALRGSAGLHFALPVAQLEGSEDALGRLSSPDSAHGDRRPLVALAPDGEPLRPGLLPARAILAFGTERQGLSRELLDRADLCVRLPMREGVSSLNLATSVAALLYSQQLSGSKL
jgi:TrmH family RNA methyltransferase